MAQELRKPCLLPIVIKNLSHYVAGGIRRGRSLLFFYGVYLCLEKNEIGLHENNVNKFIINLQTSLCVRVCVCLST